MYINIYKYHISQLNIKLSKALFILRRSRHLLSKEAMKSLYYSIFHSHLSYGILAYSSATACTLKPIIKLQKMAIRCIANVKYNAHTGKLFKELSILPFDQLVQLYTLQFMSDFKNIRLPRAFNNLWSTVGERNNHYRLRNANDFVVPQFRTELVRRLPLCKFPTLWNSFEAADVKNNPSKFAFKKKVKQILLDSISVSCSKPNCQSCV